MSDDLLHQDLSRLAQRAELDAGALAPAEAVIHRARRRRRNVRALEGAMALVVVAAATTGIVLSRPSGHQNVAVSARGGPTATISGPSQMKEALGPAAMRAKKGATGTICTAVHDPVTSLKSGPLHSGATGVSAVWLPSRPTNGACDASVTKGTATAAASLVKAIEAAQVTRGSMSCPLSTITPGKVELAFDYGTGRSWAVVSITLGSCPVATLPGGQERLASGLDLAGLGEPAWAAGKLEFGSSATTSMGNQKHKVGG